MIETGDIINGEIVDGSNSSSLFDVSIGGDFPIIGVPCAHKDLYFSGMDVTLGFLNTDSPVIISRGFQVYREIDFGTGTNSLSSVWGKFQKDSRNQGYTSSFSPIPITLGSSLWQYTLKGQTRAQPLLSSVNDNGVVRDRIILVTTESEENKAYITLLKPDGILEEEIELPASFYVGSTIFLINRFLETPLTGFLSSSGQYLWVYLSAEGKTTSGNYYWAGTVEYKVDLDTFSIVDYNLKIRTPFFQYSSYTWEQQKTAMGYSSGISDYNNSLALINHQYSDFIYPEGNSNPEFTLQFGFLEGYPVKKVSKDKSVENLSGYIWKNDRLGVPAHHASNWKYFTTSDDSGDNYQMEDISSLYRQLTVSPYTIEKVVSSINCRYNSPMIVPAYYEEAWHTFVYLGTRDEKLYCIEDNTQLWNRSVAGPVKGLAGTVISNIPVVVGTTTSGNVFCEPHSYLSGYTWNTSCVSGSTTATYPTLAGDKIFCCFGNTLYCLDFSGSIVCNNTFSDSDSAVAPPVVTSDGRILIISESGVVTCF